MGRRVSPRASSLAAWDTGAYIRVRGCTCSCVVGFYNAEETKFIVASAITVRREIGYTTKARQLRAGMAPSERERGDAERERPERGGDERPRTPRGISGYWNMMREGYDEVRRRLHKPLIPASR